MKLDSLLRAAIGRGASGTSALAVAVFVTIGCAGAGCGDSAPLDSPPHPVAQLAGAPLVLPELLRERHSPLGRRDERLLMTLRTSPGFDPRYVVPIRRAGLSGRFWLASWGDEQHARPGVCVFYLPTGAQGPGAFCFNRQTYARGRAVVRVGVGGRAVLLGVVPSRARRVLLTTASRSRVRLPVRTGIYAATLRGQPLAVAIKLGPRWQAIRFATHP
jgi:hypothetical protein